MNFTMAAQSSLYNEERNLLRIQAKERRNQEAHQERETFPANVPLFGEPYKINKADELSSRIQKMFGSYEEMKALIATKAHQNFIGIPVMSLIPQDKPNRLHLPEKTSSVFLPPSFQNINHHHKPLGPLTSGAPSAGNTVHYQKVQSRMEPASQSDGLPSNRRPCPEQSSKTQEVQSSRCQKKTERCIEEDIANELQASLLELSPLLSTLSSPVAPLSPLHSSQRVNSRSQGSSNKNRAQKSSPVRDLVTGTQDKTLDSLNAPVAAQPSSQTFPPSLPSKPSAIQQKPTAYVRPMDGQDQAPDESPELKPLLEEYHEQSYEKIADLKPNPKTKLSKLKIPAEPIEQSFSNEVHCVEDILKEMTHSWPPPLTAIHTPSTAEPSKFPFPAKESQHAGSVIQSQKQYDAPSKTLSLSQQGTSTLQEDLQISDSEDGDDDQVSVSDKPSSSSTPPSAPQSQPESVVLAHSSSPESGSTSDSDSSSDSESESSDSDSEGNEPPTRASTPEPDPQTSNRWQLNNWLIKVNQPVSPPENFLEDNRSRSSLPESKGQGKTCSSSSSSCSSSKSECPQPTDSHSKSSSNAPRSAQELHLPTKRNYQKSPVRTEEPLDRQTVGSKHPKKSSKPLVQEGQKRGLKVESEPPALYGAKDQSSKDKPKVKTKGRPKSGDRKELKPAAPEPSEKKHKSSHHASVKLFSDRNAVKDHVAGSVLEQLPLSPAAPCPRAPVSSKASGTRPAAAVREDLPRDRFLLPFRDKKLLSPVRDCPAPQALVVKIELALLSRIPQPHGKRTCPRRLEVRESHGMKKQDMDQRSTDASSKPVHKRKQEDALRDGQKKIKRESKSLSLSGHKDSSKNKMSKLSVDTQRKEMPLPPPPPASPAQPAQKPAKPAQKRPKGDSSACSQPLGPSIHTAKSKENHKDASSSKHRKMEGKPSESSKTNKGPAEDVLNPFPVPSLPNGTSKPMKPQNKPHKQHPVEYHLKEAKRLKHKADAMTDKVGKAFKYLDAALSFIECGIAMESDVLSPKPAYTMFAETIDLIKFIMTLKSFTDSSTTIHEKIFVILCMRCQAILYMAMFRYKKDTAIKYSRTLNEHFKSSSRITQAPSPCVARSTGTPSPLSPMPSPAGSVSSQTGSSSSSCGSGSSISVPPHIPTITSSFVNITSYILYAYDLWEQADVLARRNKKFFSELSATAYALSLNSGMMELVHYIRQGLQWLRLEPNTP